MYSPFNISNPASRNHSALLQPNQTLKVTFSDIAITDECKAHVESDLLELESELYGQDGKTFVFKQTYDLKTWSYVSKTFLGHISFSGMGKVNPCVGVFLDSLNEHKGDVITVVNPHDHNIKIYPNQIVEVVCYAPIWGQDLEWKFEDDGGYMEELASTVIDPTVYKMSESTRRLNDAFYTYPRILQLSGVSYLEYHWWFRCRKQVASIAQQFPDTYPPSILTFNGYIGGEPKIRQNFRVSLNSRTRPGWEKSRIFNVSFEDSALDTEDDGGVHPFILPTLRTEGNVGKHRHYSKKERRKNRVNYQPKPHQNKWTPKPFRENDVTVRLKPWTGLDGGCRVVSDDPVPVTTSTQISLPAPRLNQDTGWEGRAKYTPPKSGYYYDDGSDQWD